MRRLAYITITLMLAAFCACSCKSGGGDDSAVTVLVTHGVDKAYYEALAAGVKDKYGIDLEFVYMFSSDPADQLRLAIAGDGLPADIVFCNYRIRDEILASSCLNLVSHSHIVSAFTYGKVKECTCEGGAVYQLPVSSKLIGIIYNESVMKEHGWKAPRNFNEMLELKRKCDAARVPFAVTDIRYTGNGFNYLFHMMGAQWLSTIEGTQWLDDFLAGNVPVDRMKEESAYFSKLVENGLFGTFTSGNPVNEFISSRSLFCIAVTNVISSPGDDVYKTMPWISEDGSNNCFTCYVNCWVMADARLTQPGREKKLEKVCRVLDYLTEEEFTGYVKNISRDNYLSLNEFVIGEDRLYSDYAAEVKAGFLQPWYYNYFTQAAVVGTGAEINSYILKEYYDGEVPQDFIEKCYYDYNPEASFDSVFGTLESQAQAVERSGLLAEVTEKLDYKHTAAITAISGAMAMQKVLDADCPQSEEVSVALLPWTRSVKDMQPWCSVAAENTVLYPGPFYEEYSYVLVPNPGKTVCAVRMTGKEIKKLLSDGFDPSGYFIDKDTGKTNFDIEKRGPYPYACVTKGGFELLDDGEYLVSVPSSSLEREIFKDFVDRGKVVSLPDGNPVQAEIVTGLHVFFGLHPEIGVKDIVWQ